MFNIYIYLLLEKKCGENISLNIDIIYYQVFSISLRLKKPNKYFKG